MLMINCRPWIVAGFILLAEICQAVAQTSDKTLTQKQKLEVQGIIKNYLHTHPELLIDSIQTFRRQQKQEQQRQSRLTLAQLQEQVLRDPGSPVAGNPAGDVTVVEFFDYLCTYCKRIVPAIQKLLNQDKKLRYVFKELPILSPDSRLAARAALVVWKHRKEKYFDFHTTLMKSKGRLSEARILRMAGAMGIDSALIKSKMHSGDISEILQRNSDLAQRLGVKGTPAFIIGDKIIPGAIDLATLQRIVAEQRKSR